MRGYDRYNERYERVRDRVREWKREIEWESVRESERDNLEIERERLVISRHYTGSVPDIVYSLLRHCAQDLHLGPADVPR